MKIGFVRNKVQIRLWLLLITAILFLTFLTGAPALASADFPGREPSPNAVHAAPLAPPRGIAASPFAAPADTCQVPVDVALVLDHSTSMGGTKLTNAKTGATSFVDYFAGGPSDTNLSPHEMALVGFWEGNAFTNVTLTTSATSMRTGISGFTADGFTNIGRGLQLGQLQLVGGTDPDYMVLLSDGNANTPQNIADPNSSGATFSVTNDFYIDVNNNGYVDSGDDISVDFPGGDATPDFVVVDGLLVVTRDSNQSTITNLFDTDENGTLNDSDDYDFGAGKNFRIINGALYLDANGDGSFAVSASATSFSTGLTDEIAVLRNGDVSAGTTYSGDGSDVYAQYWATQTKKTGTFVYVIGYGLDDGSQDQALNQSMASPGGYFDATTANIGNIFNQITQQICGIQTTKTLTSGSPASLGSFVTFTVNVKNNGNINLTNVNVTDTYNTTYLTFLNATPAADNNTNDGTLNWTNLQDTDGTPATWEPGHNRTITVTFVANAVTPTNTQNCAQSTGTPPASQALTSGNSCAQVVINQATAAGLLSFDGKAKQGFVQVKWQTGSELGTAAFNVWRSAKRDGKYVKLNVNVVPAKSMGIQGANYAYQDRTAKPDKLYFYKLEIVNVSNISDWSDAIRVRTLSAP